MSKITCPEGEAYLYETDAPYATRWDGENGTWQPFALRKWHTRKLLGEISEVSLVQSMPINQAVVLVKGRKLL